MRLLKRFGVGRGLLALALLCGISLAPVRAEVPVPPLKARVTDLTQTLSPQQQQSLERALADLEARKGAQIAVLIVPTTQPETIEQYARRVLDVWKLGRKGIDDGALLLVAKDDHKLRIETQYGLEGVIPDAIAKRVIAEDIAPSFKRGDFYGGIDAGVSRLTRLVEGEPLPPPRAKDISWSSLDQFFPFLLFGILIIGGFLRTLFGHLFGAGIASAVVGVALWLMIGSILFAGAGAIVAFIFVLLGGGGGWGGGSGWSSGGGGFSGGGFSGGGGMGGGGGASGNW
jgi:uncharacterized protein